MRKASAIGVLIFAMAILSVNFVWAQATTKSTPQLKFNAGIHCWETGLNPPLDPYGYFKFRISQLGHGSFILNGRQIYYQDVLPWPDSPVTGNAELIDGKWEMNLIAASQQRLDIPSPSGGASICRASIDEDTLEGTFTCWSIRLRHPPNPGENQPQHLPPGDRFWHDDLTYKMKPINCH
jgi:hypothetical protein